MPGWWSWASRSEAAEPPGFHTTARESPNVHISGFRPSKTPTKFNERTPRERKKNENCGGRREKKSEILGCLAEGCPAEGCPAEGCPGGRLSSRGFSGGRGVHRRGGPAEGSIGNGQGSGFRVQFRFFGTKTETEQKLNEERDE